VLAFAASCGLQDESAQEVRDATDAVRQQIAKYTAALDAADTTIASVVWLTSPDVSFISPASHQHGWEEVKKVYEYFGASFSNGS
jgi:ketosteroid isomerase-like protein